MESKDEGRDLLYNFLNTSLDDRVPRGTTGDTSIQKSGPVMTVQRDESLPRVFRKLASEGFLSAPVLDYDGITYIGFITMLDLVKHTTKLFWADTEEQWVDFFSKQDRFQETLVEDVMRVPSVEQRDPFPPARLEYSHFYALEKFARTNFLHRMACVNPETDRVENIITQSMMISFLRQNKEKMGSLRTLKVREFASVAKKGIWTKVQTIKQTNKAVNAFNKMVNQEISGLAVVDDVGVLTGAISIRDLRGVGTSGENFFRLFRTVKEFKRMARQDYPRQASWVHFSNKPVPVDGLYVTPEHTFEDVLDRMNDGNIHRVFICSELSVAAGAPKPVNVISQQEVCMEALTYMINNC